MKFPVRKNAIFLILVMTLSVFGAYNLMVSTGESTSFNPVSATPGDTNWFDITNLYVNLSFIAYMNGEEFPANTTSAVDLSGSQLYAKVIDVYEVNGTFFNPNSGLDEVAMAERVDLAVGAILGSDFVATSNDLSVTMPAGMGFPLPFFFGSGTMFGFQEDMFQGVPGTLEFPLYLNDNYTLHQAIVENDGGLTVTNDNAQFKIDANNLPIYRYNYNMSYDEQVATASLSVAWDKANGMIKSAVIDVGNSTLGDTYVDVDVDYSMTENVPLDVSVGDVFHINMGATDMAYTLWGAAQNSEVMNTFGNATNLLNEVENIPVLEMEILEVSGLYYLASVSGYNQSTGTMDYLGDQWFVGFGRFGLGFGITAPADDWVEYTETVVDVYTWEETFNQSDTTYTNTYEDTYTYTNYYQERYEYDHPVIQDAPSGPVVTPDYDIQQSWDLTTGVLAEYAALVGATVFFVTALFDDNGGDGGDGGEEPPALGLDTVTQDDVFDLIGVDLPVNFTIDITASGVLNADGSYDSSLAVDAWGEIEVNRTWTDWYYDENNTYVEESYFEYIDAYAEAAMAYSITYDDSGFMSSATLSMDGVLDLYRQFNDTWEGEVGDEWGRIDMNASMGMEMVVDEVPDPTTDDTITDDDTNSTDIGSNSTDDDTSTNNGTTSDDGTSSVDDTTSDADTTSSEDNNTPENPLPGFGVFLGLLSMMAVAVIVRRR